MGREPTPEDFPPPEEPEESPFYRGALVVIRLVAAGFMLVSVMNVGLYWFKSRHDHTDLSIGHCLILCIPLVIGIVILLISGSLARWVDDQLDT